MPTGPSSALDRYTGSCSRSRSAAPMLPTFASLTVAASHTCAARSASATVTTLSSAASGTSVCARSAPMLIEVVDRLLGKLERHHPRRACSAASSTDHTALASTRMLARVGQRLAHRPDLLHVALDPDLQLEGVEALRRPLAGACSATCAGGPAAQRGVALHGGGRGLRAARTAACRRAWPAGPNGPARPRAAPAGRPHAAPSAPCDRAGRAPAAPPRRRPGSVRGPARSAPARRRRAARAAPPRPVPRGLRRAGAPAAARAARAGRAPSRTAP